MDITQAHGLPNAMNVSPIFCCINTAGRILHDPAHATNVGVSEPKEITSKKNGMEGDDLLCDRRDIADGTRTRRGEPSNCWCTAFWPAPRGSVDDALVIAGSARDLSSRAIYEGGLSSMRWIEYARQLRLYIRRRM
ncbi:hypothetical protein PUNSTDRAFT_143220 [Punctularia strigosozonata HHB-11173 SS5]|uniref:uncharacterized protein n=1 Tax=Punctularia strigosozonata (strain HHB-11173) TaxID=741275 RepID=UPI00044186C3|nr:uncharacterized protein PUNSTDRAFT_143220 [Punctularia strigosozonata HHB-11173 SS5]EIN09786.1 hypothetical protein PUNSTDRAFT_143220 [Punctularia strigosozonata HHB-11173 SS5]